MDILASTMWLIICIINHLIVCINLVSFIHKWLKENKLDCIYYQYMTNRVTRIMIFLMIVTLIHEWLMMS